MKFNNRIELLKEIWVLANLYVSASKTYPKSLYDFVEDFRDIFIADLSRHPSMTLKEMKAQAKNLREEGE